MKIAFIICVATLAILSTGCTLSETSADDVGNQFQEGIQGRGRIVPNDPTSDAFGPEYQ